MAKEPTKPTFKIVRILSSTTVNGVPVPCGRAVSVDAATAQSLVEGGIADPSKEAVDYALSENPAVIDASVVQTEAVVADPDDNMA